VINSKQNAIKITFVFFNLFFLASCKEEKRDTVEIGRYQIVNDTKNDGVFWLDTATGKVEQCQWANLGSNSSWQCFKVRSGN